MAKWWLKVAMVMAMLAIVSCTASQPVAAPKMQLKAVTLDASKIVTGQTIYVPIYSYVYTVDRSRRMDLTATLSLRNTDLTRPIIITTVKYYDTAGNLVRTDLENPTELPPLAAIDFVVNQSDTNGGVGANFIVEWVAETQVSDPIVEAVMIDTTTNQGISFISPGRVIQRRSTAGN